MAKKKEEKPVTIPFLWLTITFIITAAAFYEYKQHYILANIGACLMCIPYIIFIIFLALRTNWKTHWFSATLWGLILFALPTYGYYYWTHNLNIDVAPKVGLRIATYNVDFYSENENNIINRKNYISKQNADILVLSELNPTWEKHVQTLKEDYPYIRKSEKIGTGYTGRVAFLSKYPLEAIDSESESPFITQFRMRITPEEVIDIIHMHPTAPMSRALVAERNDAFKSASKITSAYPQVFLGTFNNVSWQDPLKSFLEESNLKRVSSPLPTWPRVFPIAPIDAIFSEKTIHGVQSNRICMHGSNHCMIYADITHYLQNTEIK